MIRPAQPNDLPAIQEIEQNSPTAAHWSSAAYQAVLEGEDQRRTLLVAQDETTGQVAGFVVAAGIGPEWELENIVVAEAYQHRGLGVQLVTRITERARLAGAVEIHAEVRESNPALHGFYKRLGFKEIGRRAKYYALPPEDAVLIRLLISGT